MKKIALTFTIFTLIFLLSSCGGGGDSKNDDNNQNADENQNQSSEMCSYGEYECHGDDSYFCGYSGDDPMWMLSESCTNGCNSSTGKCNGGSNGNNDNPNENNNQNEDESSDTEWDPEEDYNDDEGGNNGGGSIFEPCEEGDFICHSADGNEFSYKCDKYTHTPIVLEQCGDGCDSSTGKCKPWKDPDSKLVWSSKRSEEILWDDAVSYCENLDEGGHSDWRLPNISELRTLILNCPASITGGICPVTESCISFVSCFSEECGCYTEPADGNNPNRYSKIDNTGYMINMNFWSSSVIPDLEDYSRWCINFQTAYINSCDARVKSNVRCVRNAD